MGRSSPSSSIDSSKLPFSAATSAAAAASTTSTSSSSSVCHSTNCSKSRSRINFRIGSSKTAQGDHGSRSDWPPIKALLRSTLAGKTVDLREKRQRSSLFVKVYKEGVLIGRKLDLVRHRDYDDLVTTLVQMFKTHIHSPNGDHLSSDNSHVLTYEDKDGDWMLVGDVPWEMFITNVRRLKIARADRC